MIKRCKFPTAAAKTEAIARFMRAYGDALPESVIKKASRTDLRGRGLGRKLYQDAAANAGRDRACPVLAADVTYDNIPSLRAIRGAGFSRVNRFCWQRGEKPADILHFVRLVPRNGKC